MRPMIAAPWGAGEAIKPSLRGVMMIAFSVPFPGNSLGFFFVVVFFLLPHPLFSILPGHFLCLIKKIPAVAGAPGECCRAVWVSASD